MNGCCAAEEPPINAYTLYFVVLRSSFESARLRGCDELRCDWLRCGTPCVYVFSMVRDFSPLEPCPFSFKSFCPANLLAFFWLASVEVCDLWLPSFSDLLLLAFYCCSFSVEDDFTMKELL